MPDVPLSTTPPPPKALRFFRAVNNVTSSVNDTVRTAITGNARGSLRRPILFVLAGIGLLQLCWPANVVGMVALLILALTDQVGEL